MADVKVLCTGGSGFIGTHLVDSLLAKGMKFINIDIVHPKKSEHFPYWKKCNILDVANLENIFQDYQPTHVVHLAARATTEVKTLDDFLDNTVGTASVLDAIKNTKSVSRVIVTSSQHVRKPVQCLSLRAVRGRMNPIFVTLLTQRFHPTSGCWVQSPKNSSDVYILAL